MKKLFAAIMCMLIVAVTNCYTASNYKWPVPPIDSDEWYKCTVNDTVVIRWNQPSESDINGYRAYFEKGVNLKDSVNFAPDYVISITSWDVYNNGVTQWGEPIQVSFPYSYYALYLTAYDKSGNESMPSDPVFLQIRDEEAPFRPLGVYLIIKKAQ